MNDLSEKPVKFFQVIKICHTSATNRYCCSREGFLIVIKYVHELFCWFSIVTEALLVASLPCSLCLVVQESAENETKRNAERFTSKEKLGMISNFTKYDDLYIMDINYLFVRPGLKVGKRVTLMTWF